MKFTHGYWLLRNGVKALYPQHAYEVETTADTLTVYAPTKRITRRGDVLNQAVLTVEFSSPLPDVIRVKLTHFAGEQLKPPHFELGEQRPEVVIKTDPQAAFLTSGCLAVRVPRDDHWRVEFVADDQVITTSGLRGMGLIEFDGATYLHEQLSLSVGECVYGLGERFTAFVKNGQVVDIWNQDGGTASEQTYKNIPFYLTNHGYGVFVNHPEQVSFEVASEKVERVQFSVAGQTLEYFVIYGPTPKEVLEKYTALTGRPALPPP